MLKVSKVWISSVIFLLLNLFVLLVSAAWMPGVLASWSFFSNSFNSYQHTFFLGWELHRRTLSYGIESLCVCVCLTVKSCPILCDLMDCSSPGSSLHRISQARILELCCYFLLQGIFLTPGSNQGLLCCRQILYHWATGKPIETLETGSLSLHIINCPFARWWIIWFLQTFSVSSFYLIYLGINFVTCCFRIEAGKPFLWRAR